MGAKWITEREVDLVRTLLHILKDLPSDLPRERFLQFWINAILTRSGIEHLLPKRL
jgi:hypothetical protein